MATLSAVIITRNEAHQIRRTIEALGSCDEIVIVDSGSTDNTVEICEALGCKVFYQPFAGYGAQKNFGVAQTSGQWILSIDADEVVSPELDSELKQWKKHIPENINAWYLPRTMVFMGRAFRYSKEAAQPNLRLFKKGTARFSDAQVHETLLVEGIKGYFKGILLHYSYRDLHHYFEKFNQYTSYAAAEMAAKGKKVSWLTILCRQPFEFVKMYIFQRNFMEGWPGLVWSLISSFYPVVKYLKLKTRAYFDINTE
jgi:glycosyltransferase involved in cell wall biosynthesis